MYQYQSNNRQLFVDQQTIPGFKFRGCRFDDVKPEIKKQMLKAAAAVAHHLTTGNESWAKGMLNPKRLYQMRVGDDARNMDVRDLLIYSDHGDQLGISLGGTAAKSNRYGLGATGLSSFTSKILGMASRCL